MSPVTPSPSSVQRLAVSGVSLPRVVDLGPPLGPSHRRVDLLEKVQEPAEGFRADAFDPVSNVFDRVATPLEMREAEIGEVRASRPVLAWCELDETGEREATEETGDRLAANPELPRELRAVNAGMASKHLEQLELREGEAGVLEREIEAALDVTVESTGSGDDVHRGDRFARGHVVP